jgi:hypothetical protein
MFAAAALVASVGDAQSIKPPEPLNQGLPNFTPWQENGNEPPFTTERNFRP